MLTEWRQCFDNPLPTHFVFPSERYGLDGEDGYKRGAVVVWDRNPDRAIGSWKVAWATCKKLAGVDCRLHDLRPVSYTHLDVYKRQGQKNDGSGECILVVPLRRMVALGAARLLRHPARPAPVSYTHLDVYKRQEGGCEC